MIMKETSVLKRSATENFCSSWIRNGQLQLYTLILPTPFLSLFLLLKDERERERRRNKQASKPHCPNYKYRQKKGPLRCGWCQTPQLSWKSMFALQFVMRRFDVWCVCVYGFFYILNQ